MWHFDINRLRRACAASFYALKLQMMFSQQLTSQRIFKRLAKALIRLRVCAGWSEPLLVKYTTLLEISCRGSYMKQTPNTYKGEDAQMREAEIRCLVNVLFHAHCWFQNENLATKKCMCRRLCIYNNKKRSCSNLRLDELMGTLKCTMLSKMVLITICG